jgi:hypothetical protein
MCSGETAKPHSRKFPWRPMATESTPFVFAPPQIISASGESSKPGPVETTPQGRPVPSDWHSVWTRHIGIVGPSAAPEARPG